MTNEDFEELCQLHAWLAKILCILGTCVFQYTLLNYHISRIVQYWNLVY